MSEHLNFDAGDEGHSLFAASHLYDDQAPLHAEDTNFNLIPGYTTIDDLGKDGDDTIHSAISFFNVPNCFQAPIGFAIGKDEDGPETVDVVYNEFIQQWILLALEYLGYKVEEGDTKIYLEGKTMTDVIVEWVEANWDDNCVK